MGWQTSAPALPSGSSWVQAKTYQPKGTWWGYNATIKIARLANNGIAVHFYTQTISGDSGYNPLVDRWYFSVTIGSSTTEYKNAVLATVTNAKTNIYWVGTLASGASLTTKTAGWNRDTNAIYGTAQSKVFTGPAYISKYTVSYNGNGASSGSVASQTFTYGGSVKISSNGFTKAGYTFSKWNTNTAGTGTSYSPGATYSSAANVTLYAIWNIISYTISYNANGGSGAPASQTKTYGTALTLSSTKPTRTGYTFLGWGTSSGATTATYAAGGNYTANAGATLYAVWKANTYTITYKANGPVSADQTQIKTYGVNLTLKASNAFTYTGYTFLKWNTKAGGSGTDYAASATYSSNSGLTLYAIWKKNNIPLYVAVGGAVKQVEKAYIGVNNAVKECVVYTAEDGSVKELS